MLTDWLGKNMNLLNSFHFPLAYEGWDCIISLPFLPFSHLSTSLPPAPPQKKTMASWLDEMEISWPDIENSLQPACFWFIAHGSVCALPFWPSGVFWPPAELCFYISASALAARQDAHSPIQSTWQTPVLSSRSKWNVACLHISLCILFPHTLSPPLLPLYITL